MPASDTASGQAGPLPRLSLTDQASPSTPADATADPVHSPPPQDQQASVQTQPEPEPIKDPTPVADSPASPVPEPTPDPPPEADRFPCRRPPRLAGLPPGKPVYAFLWPQYHIGGAYTDFRYSEDAYWRVQVEAVRDQADGVIL